MPEANKNFLTKVIFKIDFAEPRKILVEDIEQVKEKLKDRLPKFNKSQLEMIEVVMGPNEPGTRRKKVDAYDFLNENESEKIHIDHKTLWLEVSKYSDFDYFQRLITDALSVLNLQGNSSRLGLRYINQIEINEGNPFDWNGWINSNLIKSLEFGTKETLAQHLGVITYILDDFQIRFQYGMYNSEFPNPISKREYVLDYDCFTREPHDYAETMDLLRRMHDLIEDKFNESIDTEMQKIIGVN